MGKGEQAFGPWKFHRKESEKMTELQSGLILTKTAEPGARGVEN